MVIHYEIIVECVESKSCVVNVEASTQEEAVEIAKQIATSTDGPERWYYGNISVVSTDVSGATEDAV